ncbi:MAG TPA: class I SAM-dependent methyltransferase [Terriglobia bacterium]|nr:class I SAM-dependent methyltransferase [Terriglobia bacterium]
MSGETCVLCGCPVRDAVLQVALPRPPQLPQIFSLLRCNSCGLVMTSPRLSGKELEAFYSPEYWGRAEPDNLDWVRRNEAPRTEFLERFRREGRILDVGCGLGLFLLALDPARWERTGLEVMPAAYEQAVRHLGAGSMIGSELTEAGLPGGQFDVVTFWDSLEHLPDPVAALRTAHRALRPGGIVLLRLPNFSSYLAQHFGEDWFELSLPYHLHHFTPPTLTRVLEATGFRLRVVENSLGTQNYHAFKHTLLTRMTRRHGPRGGRVLYYLLKPLLGPWERIARRHGRGSSMQVCAERSPG